MGRRAALLVVAAGIALTLIGLFPIAAGLVAAPALAVICRPLQRRLTSHIGPHVAALLVLGVVWIVLVVPGVWLATAAIHQLPNAMSELRHGVTELRALPTPLANVNAESLIAQARAKSAGWLSATLGPTLGTIAHAIADLSIALLGLYFLLVTDDAAWEAVRRRLPFTPAGSDELRKVFIDTTRGTVLGTAVSATLQGASIGLGLRLIGNSAPAFWGLVGGFATFVPVVGNALVWVPAVIVPLLHGDYHAALLMATFGKLIPALLDRVVRTVIARRVGNTHPLVTLVGVLVGLRLVGVVGVLIGPALVQSSLFLVQLYEREYGLPWREAGSE